MGLLMKGMFGVNKKAAPLVSHNPAFPNAGKLTIIIVPNKTIPGGKGFEDVRDVLAKGSLGRSFICGNDHVWPIVGTLINGNSHLDWMSTSVNEDALLRVWWNLC